MKKTLTFITFFLFLTMQSSGFTSKNNRPNSILYLNNRSPLVEKNYLALPLGEIEASGWLKEQLMRMANGMTGKLDVIYEHVMGERNAWLGGDGDAWERGPYWIDGLLPLAYILDDQSLKHKVSLWVERILSSQEDNGFFGPKIDRKFEEGLQRNNSRDWWPRMVVLKVMQQYYSATRDVRIIKFLTNYFRYQLETLPNTPLGRWTFWAEQRGGDNLLIVYWLYNITGDEFLLELGDLIHRQTVDWTSIFLEKDHLFRQNSLHCVNLAHGFKAPIVYYQKSRDSTHIKAVHHALNVIRNTFGFPTGLWAGDEMLQFGDPTQGSELCTAVEMMYSLEEMLQITGDTRWADLLERIAFNVLPTQVTAAYDARQYYHQVNQIAVTHEYRNFSTPQEMTANLFGTLSGFPCCTSNMHQGWPKFTQNLWYATSDKGIAALSYAPSVVRVNIADGIRIKIEEETAYPFEEKIRFKITLLDQTVSSALFPFHLRIPSWCKQPQILVNGTTVKTDTVNGISIIQRTWKNGDVVELKLPMHVNVTYWYDNAAVINHGPLLYALKMEENWQKVKFEDKKKGQKFGEWYYEVTSESAWNFALPKKNLSLNQITDNFVVNRSTDIPKYPWSSTETPIVIKTKAHKIPRWKSYDGSTGPINFFSQKSDDIIKETEDIELIPYGCTTLRITEFPVR